jgi:predicted metalloprotease with PDZ domain
MVILKIPFDNETAKFYEEAPQTDKKKMQILLNLWLREFEKPSTSLDELMDDISRKAQERGLTPEILDSILNARRN